MTASRRSLSSLVNQACLMAAAGSRQCARTATMRWRLSSMVSLLVILVCRFVCFCVFAFGPDLAIPAGCMLSWTHLSIVSSHSVALFALLRCVFVCASFVFVCVRVCASCVFVCACLREKRNEHCLYSPSVCRARSKRMYTHTTHITTQHHRSARESYSTSTSSSSLELES
jgi:hypothetical protein